MISSVPVILNSPQRGQSRWIKSPSLGNVLACSPQIMHSCISYAVIVYHLTQWIDNRLLYSRYYLHQHVSTPVGAFSRYRTPKAFTRTASPPSSSYLRTIRCLVRTVFASSVGLDAKGSGGGWESGARRRGTAQDRGYAKWGIYDFWEKSPPLLGGWVPTPPPGPPLPKWPINAGG